MVLATRQQSDNLPIIGLPAIVPQEFEEKSVIGGTNLFLVKNESEIDNRFLYWLLKSPMYKRHMKSVSSGTTVRMITKDAVELFEFDCPPKEERLAISNFLWQIDDKIENTLAMNKTLEAMAMALYKHWFVDFGPFQDGNFVDSELGLIPEGWEVKELHQLSRFRNGKGLKKELKDDSGLYNVFGSNGIIGKTNETMFNTPVVAIGRVGANYGEVHYSTDPCWISDNAVTVQPSEPINIWWLIQTLRLIDYSQFAAGSAQPLITQGAIKEVKYPIPPDEMFKSYASKISPYFLQIQNNNSVNLTLTNLRDTLLPKLVSGEVRVKDIEKTVSEVL
ncbi:type I restriction enzyme, S subunit [Pricia antarctica]|uniref:Type I restriction enzyme, S subunit n=2 Tax=Pricia antarctica TaxID=641691 RepID=A0A1G7DQA6_9FLAO|nr:type I restriction enzyme, S subunit [Pricia antarctica]